MEEEEDSLVSLLPPLQLVRRPWLSSPGSQIQTQTQLAVLDRYTGVHEERESDTLVQVHTFRSTGVFSSAFFLPLSFSFRISRAVSPYVVIQLWRLLYRQLRPVSCLLLALYPCHLGYSHTCVQYADLHG